MYDNLEGTINSITEGEVETKLMVVFPEIGSKTYQFYIIGKVAGITEQDRISFRNISLPSKDSEPIKKTPNTTVEVYRPKKVLGLFTARTVIYSSNP